LKTSPPASAERGSFLGLRRTAPQKRRGDPRYAPDDRRGAAQKASYAAEQIAQELRHLCYLLVAVLEVVGGCDRGYLRSSHMSQLAVGGNVSRVTRRLRRADRGRPRSGALQSGPCGRKTGWMMRAASCR
jgi:hypothetical protein